MSDGSNVPLIESCTHARSLSEGMRDAEHTIRYRASLLLARCWLFASLVGESYRAVFGRTEPAPRPLRKCDPELPPDRVVALGSTVEGTPVSVELRVSPLNRAALGLYAWGGLGDKRPTGQA